jgi:teichuronic acid biosynthesis glycosyltransferase TuaH
MARDLVYILSTATWQAAWRRGLFMPEDRLVSSLLASERVGRLLVCNHARSLPFKLIRDLSGADNAPFPTDERTHLVQPVRLRRRDAKSVPAVQRQAAAYDRSVLRAVRKYGLQNPIAIVAHPLVAGMARLSWAQSVTWYATDDWAQHPGYERWWPAYRESYSRIAASGRRVAAVSSVLHDRVAPTAESVVVPNGLDPAEWVGPVAPPGWLAGLPRPVFVYAGTLDSRLDVGWVKSLAEAFASATIVLVGPVVDAAHLAPLRTSSNVQFREPLGRSELTGLIRMADVGLLPHRVTPLTAAMSPLKVLEYLAAGLPVAATDLPPVREFQHPRVVLVPEHGDFALGVQTARDCGSAGEQERLDFIEANSWRSRHEQLLDLALI